MPRTIRLVQLPIPQQSHLSVTGNVPLAAGALAVAAAAAGLDGGGSDTRIETIGPDATDALGDALLADLVAREEPDVLALSLYLWNTERSLDLARAVKRRSPRTRVIVGGPEVGPDNPIVLDPDAVDVAVTGEAEEVFSDLLRDLANGGLGTHLPGVASRDPRTGAFGSFRPPRAPTFELARFPSPYLDGRLPVDPLRPVYVETVRGCRSQCSFCFYPRSSSVLRTLDVAGSRALLESLRERGAREIVFLDPTFNHRPGFDELLGMLGDVNQDRALTFFAEVRAEGLTEAHARQLARAGFTKLEIGLQSVNPATLAKTRRGGNPDRVAAAATLLKDHGIGLLVDLIIGLPGDTRDDVLRGVDFLRRHGLGGSAQVFPLSVLPGTAMRATARADGVTYEPRPPYRVTRTPLLGPDDVRALFLEAEDLLDRRLDEDPRPFLGAADPAAQAPDVFAIDLDRAGAADREAAARPGAAHAALWLEGRDLWALRSAAMDAIESRLCVDPHAILDVVLAPARPFPLDLLDVLHRRLSRAPKSYAGQALAHRGEDGQHRVAVVLREGRPFDTDWIRHVDARVPVYREQRAEDALRDASALGDALPAARILDARDSRVEEIIAVLRQLADPDAVTFADRGLERDWVRHALRETR